jgi:hypothetical protein
MNVLTPIRPKTIAQVVKQCKAQRVAHIAGEHVIYVGRPHALGGGNATYNAVNGQFYGTTPNGVIFRSTGRRHDPHRWMQQLRAFFHEEIQS